MALITDVRFAHEDGALARTLRSLPALTVSSVRETSTAPGQRLFVYRFDGVASDRIRTALDSDPTVREATPVSAIGDQTLWELAFTPETKLLEPQLTARGGFVIDARSMPAPEQGCVAARSSDSVADRSVKRPRSADAARGWRERWLVAAPDALTAIWEHARSAGFEFELLDISRKLRPADTVVRADPLTDRQRTALVTAAERGYFHEPRETTLDSLAEALDISRSAVNGRLTRGLCALVEDTLVAPGGESQTPRSGVDQPPSTVSAQLYVVHPDLALSPTIRSHPDATVTVCANAGTDPHQEAYLFSIEAAAFDAVEDTLADDHTVAEATPVLAFPGRRTYRITYTDDATLLTPLVTDRGGLTLDSRSYREGWRLQLQLPTHNALSELREDARVAGIRFIVLELGQPASTSDRSGVDLTPAQTETLLAAYSHGYYDRPRETSIEALAVQLGLSPTAVSGRLRRGAARLIDGVCLDDRADPN